MFGPIWQNKLSSLRHKRLQTQESGARNKLLEELNRSSNICRGSDSRCFDSWPGIRIVTVILIHINETHWISFNLNCQYFSWPMLAFQIYFLIVLCTICSSWPSPALHFPLFVSFYTLMHFGVQASRFGRTSPSRPFYCSYLQVAISSSFADHLVVHVSLPSKVKLVLPQFITFCSYCTYYFPYPCHI